METWKHIEGFSGYEVSDLGQVRSWRRSGPGNKLAETPRLLQPRLEKGYPRVVLMQEGRPFNRFVHVLVLTAFVGPCPAGHECDHMNDDPLDPSLANLAWVTHTENIRRRACNKLDLTKAREIRARYAVGGVTQQQLADEFGVHNSVVSMTVNHHIWREVS